MFDMHGATPASAVLMVYPQSFGFDEQTATSNTFQHRLGGSAADVTARAMHEFEGFVDRLRSHGIDVQTFKDTTGLPKPNAVFPNNWLTTWPDGKLFLYPMATPSRRIERSPALMQQLGERFTVGSVHDLSPSEVHDQYLEGTGAIVFDHQAKVAYGCRSVRCNERLFREHVTALGYEPVVFGAYDQAGTAIYHTNVLMGVQSTTAVVCAESIPDQHERAMVLGRLEHSGKQVVSITFEQMEHFCGNVLELQNAAGKHFLVLSQTAYDAFTPQQRAVLATDKTLLPMAIPTIEAVGGGSARCMLAELFLTPLPA